MARRKKVVLAILHLDRREQLHLWRCDKLGCNSVRAKLIADKLITNPPSVHSAWSKCKRFVAVGAAQCLTGHRLPPKGIGHSRPWRNLPSPLLLPIDKSKEQAIHIKNRCTADGASTGITARVRVINGFGCSYRWAFRPWAYRRPIGFLFYRARFLLYARSPPYCFQLARQSVTRWRRRWTTLPMFQQASAGLSASASWNLGRWDAVRPNFLIR